VREYLKFVRVTNSIARASRGCFSNRDRKSAPRTRTSAAMFQFLASSGGVDAGAKLEEILRIGVENFADFAGKGVQFKRFFEVVVAMFGNATANGGIVGVTGHE
jgi:hypothetical protein